MSFIEFAFLKVFKMEVAHNALNVISNGGWSREELLKWVYQGNRLDASIRDGLKGVFSFISL